MLFTIKKDNKEETLEVLDVVKCSTCNCILKENDAYKVKTNFGPDFYCEEHKTKYSRVYIGYPFDSLNKYFGEVEMNEEGEPIGYKKINQTK